MRHDRPPTACIKHQLRGSEREIGDGSKSMLPYHQSPTWETRIQRKLNTSHTLVIHYSDALSVELGQRAGHAQWSKPLAGIVHEFQQPGAENLYHFIGRCTLMDIRSRQLRPRGRHERSLSLHDTRYKTRAVPPRVPLVQRYTAPRGPRACSPIYNVLLVSLGSEGSDRPCPCRFAIRPLAVLQDYPEACA